MLQRYDKEITILNTCDNTLKDTAHGWGRLGAENNKTLQEQSLKLYPNRASSVNGSFEVLTLRLTLGNGSGTDFEASQCIPMGPCRCR